ncbi:hypothetical protein D3C85_576400 [compost metagenome]
MVDPVDLLFGHDLEQTRVQGFGRWQIGAKGLFHHHPAEGIRALHQQPGRSEPAHHFTEETRRGREVEHRVARAAFGDFSRQRLVGAVIQKIALDVADALGQFGPERRVQGVVMATHLVGRFVANEVFEFFRKVRIADGVMVDSDDPHSVPQQPVTTQVVQRRHQQALDQIAMGTEQKQRGRWCRLCLGLPADRGHFFEVSTWPPKPKRMADRILSP